MKNINEKPKIVIIGGPTASGKSGLGISLAKRFDGEIVGADSMQIYKGMDIGTGKVTLAESKGIKHRMIDIVSPIDTYSTGMYKADATKQIDEVLSLGKLPIIVGGTGLYVNALISGYTFTGTSRNTEFREGLVKAAEEHGSEFLHQRLNQLDPASAQKIHSGDLKRIIRALEIYHATGKTKTDLADQNDCPYDYLLLIIDTDRKKLYGDIESRVDKMLQDGLIDEVKGLNLPSDSQAAKAIGYKETLQFLSGEINENQLSDLIKLNTRHYAKRQITYFKNVFSLSKRIPLDEEIAVQYVSEFLNLTD